MGRNSQWEGFPGGKDFLVGRNSRCEGFPSDNNFFRRKKISLALWQVFPNSCGEGFPGRKNLLVGKMFTFITKSFLGQPKSKNHRNFSACGGHVLAHKTTSSALKSQFQETASDVILHYQIAYSTICVQYFSIFSPTAKVPKNFSGLQYMRLDLLYRHDFYQKTVRLI